MPCEQIKRKKKIICAGDLDKRIELYTREITNSDIGGVDYSQTFTLFKSKWAMIQTPGFQGSGLEVFDGVNLIGTVTHFIYIRYTAGVTSEKFVKYDDRYFKILRVQDLNEDKTFMFLKCTERGIDSLEANEA